jgi:hypothetical protein
MQQLLTLPVLEPWMFALHQLKSKRHRRIVTPISSAALAQDVLLLTLRRQYRIALTTLPPLLLQILRVQPHRLLTTLIGLTESLEQAAALVAAD